MAQVFMTVRFHFLQEILGTASSNPEVHSEFIASKAADAATRDEELQNLIAAEGVDAAIDKATTIFYRDREGNCCVSNHQIKGMCKEFCSDLKRDPESKSKGLTNYKKQIDGCLFVEPRFIPIELPDGGTFGVCQRPLRGQTAQGERISLASSETAPEGSEITFTIEMPERMQPMVVEWFDYGFKRGFLQWRNSGKGSYVWEEIDNETGETIGGNLSVYLEYADYESRHAEIKKHIPSGTWFPKLTLSQWMAASFTERKKWQKRDEDVAKTCMTVAFQRK